MCGEVVGSLQNPWSRGGSGFLTTELRYLENCESKEIKSGGEEEGVRETAAVAGGQWVLEELAEGRRHGSGVSAFNRGALDGQGRGGCHGSAPPESCL